MIDEYLEKEFPACRDEGYVVTSPADDAYNCVAWAAGETDIRWWPTVSPGFYWPLRVPSRVDVQTFVQAFRTLGYEKCDQGELEPGFEKVAFYAHVGGSPTHAARQLADGAWTSKIGRYKDITHKTPAALESSAKGATDYGTVSIYMKRPRPAATSP